MIFSLNSNRVSTSAPIPKKSLGKRRSTRRWLGDWSIMAKRSLDFSTKMDDNVTAKLEAMGKAEICQSDHDWKVMPFAFKLSAQQEGHPPAAGNSSIASLMGHNDGLVGVITFLNKSVIIWFSWDEIEETGNPSESTKRPSVVTAGGGGAGRVHSVCSGRASIS